MKLKTEGLNPKKVPKGELQPKQFGKEGLSKLEMAPIAGNLKKLETVSIAKAGMSRLEVPRAKNALSKKGFSLLTYFKK